MQKTLTPKRATENDSFAICGGGQRRTSTTHRKIGGKAAGYGMEISSDKSKILVDSIKPTPPANMKKGKCSPITSGRS